MGASKRKFIIKMGLLMVSFSSLLQEEEKLDKDDFVAYCFFNFTRGFRLKQAVES